MTLLPLLWLVPPPAPPKTNNIDYTLSVKVAYICDINQKTFSGLSVQTDLTLCSPNTGLLFEGRQYMNQTASFALRNRHLYLPIQVRAYYSSLFEITAPCGSSSWGVQGQRLWENGAMTTETERFAYLTANVTTSFAHFKISYQVPRQREGGLPSPESATHLCRTAVLIR